MGGGESNIIRADITVGISTNEGGTVYGYSKLDDGSPNFGQCSNSKIFVLFSQDSPKALTGLWLTTPMVASNVTITRLDTMYSISATGVDTTKNLTFIDGSLFTQQDLDKTIPIEIRFA